MSDRDFRVRQRRGWIIGCVVVGTLWLCFVGIHDSQHFIGSTFASGVQGVGTILAVVIASGVALWQTDEARAREDDRARRFVDVVLGMSQLARDELLAIGEGMTQRAHLALTVKNRGPWPIGRPVADMLRSVDINRIPDAEAVRGLFDLMTLCARGDELVSELKKLTPQERLSDDLNDQLQKLAMDARDAYSRIESPLRDKGALLNRAQLEGDPENKYRRAIAKVVRGVCLATINELSQAAHKFGAEESVAAMRRGDVPWPNFERSQLLLGKIDIAQVPSALSRDQLQIAIWKLQEVPQILEGIRSDLERGGDWETARNKFEGWIESVLVRIRRASRILAQFDDCKMAPEEDERDS